ncbi:MAG: hypothetical protein R3E01_06635 [Pirellulaceae bacterium]|nr:hypothetical protein [Planctomycetales bacterium]
MTMFAAQTPNVLAIFGHPGHELFLFQWFTQTRCQFNCFTDGSGGTMADRTAYSRNVIDLVNGTYGPVFGLASDKQLYQDILNGNANRVTAWTERLIETALQLKPETIVTDPFEYFNPVHDLANSVTDIVIAALSQRGIHCRKLVYPNEYPRQFDAAAARITISLDAQQIAAKQIVVEGYEPLRHELARLTQQQKLDALRCETLFDDPVRLHAIPAAADTPFERVHYEDYGRQMIANGLYSRLLTLDGHYRAFVASVIDRSLSIELCESRS